MRTSTLLLLTSLLYITSCTTGKYTASREYDDVYSSKSDKNVQASAPAQQNNTTQPADYSSPQNSERRESIGNDETGNQRFDYNTQNENQANQQQPDYTTTQQEGGNTYVTNNYYNEDDYYDYAYSSRLRRFYHPVGWGYYDTYYTNSYWYDYNPYSWGISIYCGYSFWQPHHSWGITMGYGYPGYYNDPWHNPYYGGYGGYGYGGGYYQGYQNGYMNGYYNGLYNGSFNPYYFNSYDSYSYYYGPRGKGSSLNAAGGPRNVGQLYANNTQGNAVTPGHTNTTNSIQPFVKIKQNTALANQNGNVRGGDIRDPKGGNSSGDMNTGGVKSPNVKGNTSVPIKSNNDSKGGDYASPNPIKVPADTKGNQNNNNVDGAPIKNPSNIKVNHNAPVKTNPDIRYDNNGSGNDIRNNNGGIKTPKDNTPIRNNQNDYAPSQPGNNIKTPRNEQPVKDNDNAPVKSPRINGPGNDRQPVKNQPQNNYDQRNDSEQNNGKKNGSSPRTRVNQPDNGNSNSERKSSSGNNERNTYKQQSAPAAQPRQSEQRNSNNSGGRPR